MNNKVQQLPGESDYNYEKRLKALEYLGEKWILAKAVQKPEKVEWRL